MIFIILLLWLIFWGRNMVSTFLELHVGCINGGNIQKNLHFLWLSLCHVGKQSTGIWVSLTCNYNVDESQL